NQAQRWARRIDVCAARYVLLQNVILNRAIDFLERDAVTPCDGQIKTEQSRSGRVDSHRSRDGIQRDAVEESLHVFDGVNRYADFADFACGERIIGIKSNL